MLFHAIRASVSSHPNCLIQRSTIQVGWLPRIAMTSAGVPLVVDSVSTCATKRNRNGLCGKGWQQGKGGLADGTGDKLHLSASSLSTILAWERTRQIAGSANR